MLDLLLAEPELLDTDVWPMLGCEGAGRRLAQMDKIPNFDGWIPALTALTASGLVERSRVLDVGVQACVADWRPVDVTWYRDLLRALAPTTGEVVARQAQYLLMLAAAPSQTVQLAQQDLGRLLVSGDLDVEGFIAASAAVLARTDKARVLAQFELLDQLIVADPVVRQAVSEIAESAAHHGHPDVRERAARYGVVPRPGPTESELPGNSGLPTEVGLPGERELPTESELPADSGLPTESELPAERERAAVYPVRDAEELVELFGRLIVDSADPVDVDRALEGVARLAGTSPGKGADTLVRNAETFLASRNPGAWSGEDVRADLATLVLTWLRGDPPSDGRLGREVGYTLPDDPFRDVAREWTLPALVSLRIHEVAQIVLAGGGRLLSLPSFYDGSITAADLATRTDALPPGYRGWSIDLAVTALRAEPGSATTVAVKKLSAVQRTLAGYSPDWQPVSGTSVRPYNADIQQAPAWRDASSAGGLIADPLSGVLDRADPLRKYGAELDLGTYTHGYEQVIALWPLIFPFHPELLAAHAHPRMYRAIEYATPSVRALTRAFGGASTTVGPVVCSALALGMSAKDLGERTAVVDALVDLCGRNLLDSRVFGGQVARLMEAGVLIGGRVAQSLTDFSTVSGGTRPAAGVILEQVLPILPGRRDAHLLVDLLAQVADHPVLLPTEFERLGAGKASSMLAKALRRLP